MKVRDTQELDLIRDSLTDKLLNFIHGTDYRYTDNFEATRYIIKHFPSWQYNGADKFENILVWCQKHLGNNFVWNWETIYFKTEADRTLFLLRWT